MPGSTLSRRQLLATAAVAGLAGCPGDTVRPAASDWPQPGHDPRNTGANPAADGPAGTVTERWRRAVGASSAPAVVGDRLFVAVGDGGPPGLLAVGASDGTTRWRYGSSARLRRPAVGDGVVCAGAADGTVVALSPSGGHDLPVGRLGLVRWSRSARDPVASPATIRDGVAYLGRFGAGVTAFGVGGDVAWRFRATGDAVETAPAVGNDSAYFCEGDLRGGTVFSVDVATGDADWRVPLGEFPRSAPALADGTLYAVAGVGDFHALDAATGSVEWRRPIRYVRASPAVGDGVVYVPSADGVLHALDAADGRTLWTAELDSSLDCSPTVVGDTVYAGTGGGALVALDAASGRVRWRHDLDGAVRGEPVVAGETVYVTTGAGTVLALESA